jgi:hypothetical protein
MKAKRNILTLMLVFLLFCSGRICAADGLLPAVAAWKIDEKQVKFVELKTEGLRCSRDGIVTADGGR